jgi:hypothetical protein
MYRSLLQGGWDLPIPGRIPSDPEILMTLADCPDEETWQKHGSRVMKMFDLSEDGTHYTNERQQQELAKWRKMRRDYAERGRMGGKAKQANKLNAKQKASSATPDAALARNDGSNQVKSGEVKSSQAKEELKGSSAEASSAPAPAIMMPLNTGAEYPVTQAQVTEWSKLYPAVDVMQELRNMRGWCDAHKMRRKTLQGVNRFMNSWLAREQNRGGNAKAEGNHSSSGKGSGPKGQSAATRGAYHGSDSARFDREPDIVV